jgi:hypothetical protein
MYYYGVHSCDCLPKEDIGIKYLSSSTDLNFIQDQKDNPQDYKYKIIKTFSTRTEAEIHEMLLHKKFNVMVHKKFYNKWNSNSKWSTAGLTGVTEISTGDRIMIPVAEYKLNKHLYTNHTYNKVATLDLRDNINKWVTKEEFDNNDFYVGTTYNKVATLDLRDNTNKIVSKEEFDKNDFYVGTTYNKVATLDLRDNTNKIVSKEEFDKNDFYVGVTHKYFPAVDLHGNKYHVHKDDMRVLSGELKHHSAYLINITDGINNKRITPEYLEQYIQEGWYRGWLIATENPTKETLHIHKNGIRKRIKPEYLEQYIQEGLILGLLKVVCPYCNFEGAGTSMKRFHFENCKVKLKEQTQ